MRIARKLLMGGVSMKARCCKCKREIDSDDKDWRGGLCGKCWQKQKKVKRGNRK